MRQPIAPQTDRHTKLFPIYIEVDGVYTISSLNYIFKPVRVRVFSVLSSGFGRTHSSGFGRTIIITSFQPQKLRTVKFSTIRYRIVHNNAANVRHPSNRSLPRIENEQCPKFVRKEHDYARFLRRTAGKLS